MKMKCVIYARTSTVDQEVKNQVNELNAYAEKQGWDIADTIIDQVSGSKNANERTGLNHVFNLAHKKKFDVLLFWSLDRLSREGSRKTLEYLTKLDDFGIDWHSYSETYLSSLGVFKDALIAILSALAKQERIRISERTKAGLNRIRKTKKLGRPTLAKNLQEVAQQLRREGNSFSAISKKLEISKTSAFNCCHL